MPPTGRLGMGVDQGVVMLITGRSIRETLPFPSPNRVRQSPHSGLQESRPRFHNVEQCAAACR